MKIKNILLSLSLAGICFSQASAQQIPHPSRTAAGHIGDGVKSIGDTNRYISTTDDLRPDEFVPSGLDAQPISTKLDMSLVAPAAFQSARGGGSSKSRTKSALSSTWFSAESLLWFSENQNTPPLVTTSAQGVLPIWQAAGVTTAFGGGDGIDSGVLPGFRISGGKYLGACEKVGIGGRAYGIFSDDETYTATSNGSTSIGIPFFNVNPARLAEDAYLVAFTTNLGQPVSSGTVTARSDLDMFGADGSFYVLLGRSNDHRIDLVAGYSYNRLKTSIGVQSTSTNLFTGDLIPDGTVFNTNDLFETENIFNGAHLGVLSSVVRNRVSLNTLAKVSFGNMRQSGDIRGFTQETFGGTTTSAGGIFTQASNIGAFSRDVFAFIPELNLKLGYNVHDNIQLNVGYSFMFWSSVGLAGEQMDRVIDLDQTVTRPTHTFVDSSFWMQGIDLGMTLTY